MAANGGGGVIVPLERWFFDVPPVTRCWTTLSVLTSVLVQCDAVSPYQLFFTFHTALTRRQYWRFVTTFLYFGPLSLDFVFHIFFMSRYSRMLEDSFFRGHTFDFMWLMLYAATALILLSPLASLPFLGSPLSFALVYIWARRNPAIRLSFLGLFVFSAPYLPWVLFGFSLVFNSAVPKGDLLGIAVGHVYFFLEDVFPRIYGVRPLAPPWRWPLWHSISTRLHSLRIPFLRQ
ncbi:Der1-like family-domain-containing protein [Limtongia smithiae]|uniref:Der1-like family-domain-containing protein n=1 Tax=Limtongia smithiae TaxID=1125753 RepID=UPI0034CE7256